MNKRGVSTQIIIVIVIISLLVVFLTSQKILFTPETQVPRIGGEEFCTTDADCKTNPQDYCYIKECKNDKCVRKKVSDDCTNSDDSNCRDPGDRFNEDNCFTVDGTACSDVTPAQRDEYATLLALSCPPSDQCSQTCKDKGEYASHKDTEDGCVICKQTKCICEGSDECEPGITGDNCEEPGF